MAGADIEMIGMSGVVESWSIRNPAHAQLIHAMVVASAVVVVGLKYYANQPLGRYFPAPANYWYVDVAVAHADCDMAVVFDHATGILQHAIVAVDADASHADVSAACAVGLNDIGCVRMGKANKQE
ncbi:hypothetical protein FBU30_007917 [Linnemannia zychae]|nr:hypothetical protein FBU30_007917 [Linnemannia zychae]